MRNRLTIVAMLLALVGSGCTDAAEEPEREPAQRTAAPSPSPEPPHPVSLQALMDQEHEGGDLTLRRQKLATAEYRQHRVTYRSGDLRISGVLNVPRGTGPFPAVVMAHGYIDPRYYVNGQGMRREIDWLARNGYVVLHVDYRNHAGSDRDPESDTALRLGYTEDVINAVHALRAWDGPVDDDRVGLVGRSMGGGVIYNVLTVAPGLVDAAVVFAPVSSDTVDNFERWIRPDPGRENLSKKIIERYGEPAKNPDFWRNASPRTFFDRVSEPILIHHGTSDDSCPVRWSRETARALENEGVDVTLRIYEGEEHAFGPRWPQSMRRTVRFLEEHL